MATKSDKSKQEKHEKQEQSLRQPIVTVCGHVDHGKTSILDRFRGSSLQELEAGGITQKISFTKYPLEQIKKACPLIAKQKINLEIPGFLFIDTPGHAAFTNLRKRGGSLADLAIVVVSIKEGIKPQTAEVLQILKSYKTPFLIALNKIDTISGWTKKGDLKQSIESQAINVNDEFQQALLTFQGSLSEHGFESSLFYEITDFTKQIAIVPCSARTGEGISELLFVLCGLCQKFLQERLKPGKDAKGVILEVRKEKGLESTEAILYDGELKTGDEVAIASLNEPIVSKVRAIEEVLPLSIKFHSVEEAKAATGIRMQLSGKEEIMPGTLFQKLNNNLEQLKSQFKHELSGALKVDKQGIIIKADSLGSLEALVTLLKQENISIVKSGIGTINKQDLAAAKANLEINPLDSIIVGFNVSLESETDVPKDVKILTNDVIYKLIEDLQAWRKEKQAEIEKAQLMELATLCKLEILPQYVFRNSNPAIFGVKVLAGKVKVGIPLIDENGESIAHVKSLQHEKSSVQEATEGQELAMALPGLAFDRHLKDKKFLYSDIGRLHVKKFKEHKSLLSAQELRVLDEIIRIKKLVV